VGEIIPSEKAGGILLEFGKIIYSIILSNMPQEKL